MPPASTAKRPLAHTLLVLAVWVVFYGSFTLFTPALLDDADSVHAEVAREILLRHDWVTLYANGIRYLEKAPLLYWAMAVCMRISQMLGHPSPQCLAVAARLPMGLTVLALALAVEGFARRAFASARAGLYAALIVLSSFGIFLFTRILLPDAMLTLWLTLALLAFWMSEARLSRVPHPSQPHRDGWDSTYRPHAIAFAVCCALGLLTKGLIGLLFPLAIVAAYLLLTKFRTEDRVPHPSQPYRDGWVRTNLKSLATSFAIFLAIAAPWHILIALANPTQGHPGGLTFTHGHWQVPLPTDGNVHGWAWFYFVNEHLLRYLNLRVPRDYDTVPLWLFWGLCLIWLMPWSAFLFKAIASAVRRARTQIRSRLSDSPYLLLLLWAAIPLLFFSFSTRQEYYVLPSLPSLAILIAGYLANQSTTEPATRRTALGATAVLLAVGTLFAAASVYFLLRTHTPAPNTDLATLLQQNPADYALSMGHFLDLNANALGLFRIPLALAGASLFFGPLASYLLRRRGQIHAATLALAAGAFAFLLAAHLGLRTFAPVLSSQQLAAAIAPQLQPGDVIVVHQEYEFASTLGFYLERPGYRFLAVRLSPPQSTPPADNDRAEVEMRATPINPIHILTDPTYNNTPNYGRSSNLWYGSFFPDAPGIFETAQSLAAKWPAPQRIFLWQDLANQPSPPPALPTPVYVIAAFGGKEILSNQPNHR